MALISIGLAALSFVLSAITLWLTYLRSGSLRMTAPTILFFGYDTVPQITPKVFLRTLLYSTAAQGHVIESMHLTMHHDGATLLYTFWGYGQAEKLTAGGGLYVSRTGFSANHHFVRSVHDSYFAFTEGEYQIEVWARIVGKKMPKRLAAITLSLSAALATTLARHEGVLFERRPDGTYEGHGQRNS